MPSVRIPRSAVSRREKTYALLLARVYPRRTYAAFDGKMFRCGATIDEAELWPDPEYPETPLLLEFAGSDKSGRGHNRSNDIHVLWKYDRARLCWVEIMRSLSQGAEWIIDLKPVVMHQLKTCLAPPAGHAAKVSERVLALLDLELDRIGTDADRDLVMSFVYEQFMARLAA